MDNRLYILGILIIALFMPSVVTAEPDNATYVNAKKALARGDNEQFFKLRDQMVDHPLYPYLDYYHIRRYFDTIDDAVVREYINTYSKTPMADKLRAKLQAGYIKDKKWKEYVAMYQPTKKVIY